MRNYSNLPWGFAPSTQHIIKEEPRNAHPRTLRGSFYMLYELDNPSVSLRFQLPLHKGAMGRVLQRNDFAKPGTFSYVGGGGTLQHLPASPVQGEVARSAGGVVRRA